MHRITHYTSKLSNKWITLGICSLQSISIGVMVAIAACMEDIRATFQMTENQYGLISTLYMTGSLLMFLPGILLDKYGPVLVNTISLILTLLSHGAIWQLAKSEPFPAQKYLLYVSFFCGGLSFSGTSSVSFSVNLSNFHKSAHGKVTGTQGLLVFLGGSIFNELYAGVFSPNLSDYFLMVTVFTGIVYLLMVLFVRRVNEYSDYSTIDEDDGYSVVDCDGSNNDVVNTDDKNNINPLKTPAFYILLIICVCIVSAGDVVLCMVSTFSESFGLGKYTTNLLTMSTIVSATSVLLLGVISDFILKRVPRMFVALIPTLAQTLSLFIAIFQINHVEVLILLIVTNSIVFVIYDSLLPSELHACFGNRHYGKIFGFFSTSTGFSTMALEYFTTSFYENEKRKQNSPDEWCHGKICFFPGLLLMSILNIIASVFIILYLYRKKRQGQKPST